jgi:surface polysaccharide O-acyltransferase-like enzyme
MERNYSIDFVKFFAIFAVVAIHSKTVAGTAVGALDGDDINFVINTLARFAVPFFFVVSGYLFVQKINSIEEKSKIDGCSDKQIIKQQLVYFKKYIFKLTKLYFAWFIFYFLFQLIVNFTETEKTGEAITAMLREYMTSFHLLDIFYYGSGSPQYHLWFLLALIWSTIILFIFTKAKLLPALLVISLALNIYGLFGQSYSAFHEVSVNTRDAVFFGLFYIALGGMAGNYVRQIKAAASSIPIFMYVGLLSVFSLSQIAEAYVTLKVFDGNEENYYLSTIPLTIILFMMVIKYSHIGKHSIMAKIGANAVGIYVSHVFLLQFIPMVLERFGIENIQDTLTWDITFTPVVFILAYLLYFGLQKGKASVADLYRREKYIYKREAGDS